LAQGAIDNLQLDEAIRMMYAGNTYDINDVDWIQWTPNEQSDHYPFDPVPIELVPFGLDPVPNGLDPVPIGLDPVPNGLDPQKDSDASGVDEELRKKLGDEAYAEILRHNKRHWGNYQGLLGNSLAEMSRTSPHLYQQFLETERQLEQWLEWLDGLDPVYEPEIPDDFEYEDPCDPDVREDFEYEDPVPNGLDPVPFGIDHTPNEIDSLPEVVDGSTPVFKWCKINLGTSETNTNTVEPAFNEPKPQSIRPLFLKYPQGHLWVLDDAGQVPMEENRSFGIDPVPFGIEPMGRFWSADPGGMDYTR